MIYLYTEAALFALLLLCAPFMLYADYAAVMNFKRVREEGKTGVGPGLTKLQSVCGSYILTRGYLLDFFVNTVHMTILLRELPRELTVTRRLRRHITDGTRHAAFCLRFRQQLDALDPAGTHD